MQGIKSPFDSHKKIGIHPNFQIPLNLLLRPCSPRVRTGQAGQALRKGEVSGMDI
jgi:hypothetical protein